MEDKYTLYARYINTTDSTLLKYQKTDGFKLRKPYHQDVEIRNNKGKILFIVPWHNTNKPTKRNKYQMYNCFRYNLKWKE